MVKHTPTFKIHRYASSSYAEKITYKCSCGKSGSVTDGRSAPTMKRARAAFQRHVERATPAALNTDDGEG